MFASIVHERPQSQAVSNHTALQHDALEVRVKKESSSLRTMNQNNLYHTSVELAFFCSRLLPDVHLAGHSSKESM